MSNPPQKYTNLTFIPYQHRDSNASQRVQTFGVTSVPPQESQRKIVVSPGPGRLPWDTGADQFAILANDAGKDAATIARELILNGYSATRFMVADSLKRQGAKKPPNPELEDISYRRWDTEADAFAVTQHNSGYTAQQIAPELIKRGYAATRAEVEANLQRLGVQQVQYGRLPVTPQPSAPAFSQQYGHAPVTPQPNFPQAQYGHVPVTPQPTFPQAQYGHVQVTPQPTFPQVQYAVTPQPTFSQVPYGYAPVTPQYTTPQYTTPQYTTPQRTTSQRTEPAILRWNTQADTFAMAAHRSGLTVAEIMSQLTRNGYSITATEVRSSLHRQGATGVR